MISRGVRSDAAEALATPSNKRLILVESSEERREILERRLASQGYTVECAADPAIAADMALSSPPDVVVADLWMPSISGVQLCRLLRGEPATADVPIILRGDDDDPRSRFWAERAGATAYVARGRTGDLVRSISRAVDAAPRSDGFFMQLSGGSVDIRDRIARHLDAALFDSVIASEVRALCACGSFERLFDGLAQFLSQVMNYRWLALATDTPARAAIHHHPRHRDEARREARAALAIDDSIEFQSVDDEDARGGEIAATVIVRPVYFGGVCVGRLAVATPTHTDVVVGLVDLVAKELGGAIRMASLVEESERLASTDPLTGAMNRRAGWTALEHEHARTRRHGTAMSVLLIDVDHFKAVNDTYGHAAGDAVLVHLASVLKREVRVLDTVARWGGEEFIVVLSGTDLDGAAIAGERIRRAIESENGADQSGIALAISASIGVATVARDESIESLVERADAAMYAAKKGGRNRVCLARREARTSNES